MQSRNRKTAYIGLFTACGILFGYIEFLLPLPIGIPGVKIGLSNIVTLSSLFLLGPGAAFIVMLLRIVLSGLMFGNFFGILYSLAGGIAAYITMLVAKRLGIFGVLGISIVGGVFHNIGQLVVAAVVVTSMKLIFYLPALLISGLIAGAAVGIASGIIINRLQRFVRLN